MEQRGHKNALQDLTAKYVREILHYDPKTGVFTWRKTLSRRIIKGRSAGHLQTKRRIKIGIHGKIYMAHRLAWLYTKGRWPKYEIDHIDGNQCNNVWENLRSATPSQNHRNRGKQKNNTTGYKGVCFARNINRYVAGIKLHGKRYHLGCFTTAEEASKAYIKATNKFHGRFSKGYLK